MNYYNANLINSVGISNIMNLLLDKSKVDEIINSLDGIKDLNKGKTRGDYYISFLAINQYISKKLKYFYEDRNSLSKEEIGVINYYVSKLYEKAKTNELALYSLDFGLEDKYLQSIYDDSYNKRIKRKNETFEFYEKKYFASENLTSSEKKDLFASYQILLDRGMLSDDLRDKLIGFIINKGKTDLTLEENRLFLSLVAQKEINENKIYTTFVVSDYGYGGTEQEKNLHGYCSKEKVFFNKKILDSSRGDCVETLYHELEHRKQYERVMNGEFNWSSFEFIKFELFSKYSNELNTSEKEFDYYHRNYFFDLNKHFRMQRIEMEADAVGYEKTGKLLKKYHKENGEKFFDYYNGKRKESMFVDNLGTRINGENKVRLSTEEAEIRLLDKILKNHPEEIKEYSQLSNIYKEDGTKKSFKDMLCISYDMRDYKNVYSSEEQDPFFDYIRIGIDYGELDKIDINKCTISEQNKIFNTLNHFAYINARKVKDLMRNTDYLLADVYIKTLNNEITRMKKLEKKVEKFKNSDSYSQGNSVFISETLNELKEFYNKTCPDLIEEKNKKLMNR